MLSGIVRRLWFVVAVVWSLFWAFLYVIGTAGLSPAELLTQRANTTVLMAIPWVAGWLIFWIASGSRR